MKRREFLIKSLAAGGLLAAGSTMPVQTAMAAEPKKFKVKPTDDNWVIISDLHTNPGAYQDEYLQRAVADILKLTPRPTHVIALGDIAYLTGQLKEYQRAREILAPIWEAGIQLTIGMGNHDRREVFAQVFPEIAAKSVLKNSLTYVVEGKNADFIVLDSLQEGEDKKSWFVDGALDEEQKQWLAERLKRQTKPVFVSSHHPLKEIKIARMLMECPQCAGYIHGHDHRWRLDWTHIDYQQLRVLPILCVPSTGHWGDIGLVRFVMESDKATAYLCQKEFFFPRPQKPEETPILWKEITDSHSGAICPFRYQ